MKILVLNTVPYKKNGVTNVIWQYYTAMVNDEMQFDFAGINQMPADLSDEVVSHGGQCFVLAERNRNPIKYLNHLKKICLKGKYDIVHVHGNSSTMVIELCAAWMARVPVRISHGHSSSCNSTVLHNILWPAFRRCYTQGLACSRLAGDFLFRGEQFRVCQNAFDVNSFSFAEEQRSSVRKTLCLENKIVWGNVATLTDVKNHEFLLKAFAHYCQKENDAALVIVGNGKLESQIREKAKQLNIEEKVLLLGARDDVAKLMNAFDYFVFPSKFEGLGIVLLEAQANGLPVIASRDVIPQQVALSENFYWCKLTTPEDWADFIEEIPQDRVSGGVERVQNAGYEIRIQADKMRELYISLVEKSRMQQK